MQQKYVKLCDMRFSEVNIKITVRNFMPCNLVDKLQRNILLPSSGKQRAINQSNVSQSMQ
jgi:hypothetical protein